MPLKTGSFPHRVKLYINVEGSMGVYGVVPENMLPSRKFVSLQRICEFEEKNLNGRGPKSFDSLEEAIHANANHRVFTKTEFGAKDIVKRHIKENPESGKFELQHDRRQYSTHHVHFVEEPQNIEYLRSIQCPV